MGPLDIVPIEFERESRTARGVRINAEEVLEAYKAAIDEAKNSMENYFNLLPQNRIKVQWLSSNRKNLYWDYYEPSSLDGKESAVLNVKKPEYYAEDIRIATSVSHEVYPGHHLQMSVQRMLQGVPLFRKMCAFEGFNEGWANYSETLYYNSIKDDEARIAVIQSQLFQAAMAVIDTGINYKGWSTNQASIYLAENVNKGGIMDIEKCVELPGKACSNFVGGMKILELRDKAKAELKGKFILKDFNDLIIKNGSMPLPLLEKQVGDYIRLNK
jgi:uncharacterized protein (DUF885 family)